MEQSPDLDSYLRYFILSVDYMVSETEELVGKVVKSRFHDWFISRESTKLLSVCHLDKLVTSYDIFEHCSKIDTLLFLVDWVLNGQTEEHEALACEIIDPKVVEDELSGDDQESDNAPQSDDELKNNTSDVPQNDNVPQAGSETQSDNDLDPNKGPKNEGDTQTSHDVPPQKGSESPIKDKTQNENELQNTEKPETEQEYDVEEEKDDDSEEKERQNCHPISYNIPQKIQMLHRKFESVNGCIQLKDKCKEAIAELVSNDIDMMKQFDEGIADGNIEHLNQELASDSDLMDSIESEDLSQGTHVEQIKVGGSESRLGNLSKQIQKSVIKKTKEADEIHLSLKPNTAERLEVGNSVSKEESSIDQIKDAHEETDDTKDENESRFSVITQSTESGEIISQTETKTENSIEQTDDSCVEHVLFAVSPKKRLKDAERVDSVGWLEEIFDICVYIPPHKTWYYFGVGENDGAFENLGKSKSSYFSPTWLNNFCTKDYLCLGSPDESSLYMYPLKRKENRWDPGWSTVSYEDRVENIFDFQRTSDVRFCCADGETIYMVIREKICEDYYHPESKTGFKCFRLSAKRSWEFLFETRYLLNSEDNQLFESMFDVYVSPENTDMLIAIVSRFYLHTFFVDLKDEQAEIRYNFLEPGASKVEDRTFLPRTGFWILFNDKCLTFVDENFVKPKFRYYRYMEAKKSETLSIGYTGHRVIEHTMPSDYKETTCSKLIHSVSDRRSAWAFLSDGKFKTSLEEIRISSYGYLEFRQRTPPPFSEITLMACGTVRRKHLAHLKPMREFLQE